MIDRNPKSTGVDEADGDGVNDGLGVRLGVIGLATALMSGLASCSSSGDATGEAAGDPAIPGVAGVAVRVSSVPGEIDASGVVELANDVKLAVATAVLARFVSGPAICVGTAIRGGAEPPPASVPTSTPISRLAAMETAIRMKRVRSTPPFMVLL